MTDTSATIGAVILAAGFGTRLGPLTDKTPKPLLDVGDKPVISHLVERLRDITSLGSIVVVVNGRHRDQWDDWRADLPDHPVVEIVSNGVVTNDERIGAVADLAAGVRHLGPTDWIVVLAGDNLIDEPLQPHIAAAIGSGRPVVLCRDLGDHVPPGRFGEVTIDGAGIVTRFREKPVSPQSPLAATCSYVLPGDCADAIDEFLGQGDPDSPGRFIGWLARNRAVVARTLAGRYFDIGNTETLAAARAAYSDAAALGEVP